MPQNCNFPSKIKYLIFCQDIAVLRPLEWFYERIEESRPPPKLNINRAKQCSDLTEHSFGISGQNEG